MRTRAEQLTLWMLLATVIGAGVCREERVVVRDGVFVRQDIAYGYLFLSGLPTVAIDPDEPFSNFHIEHRYHTLYIYGLRTKDYTNWCMRTVNRGSVLITK